MMKKTGMTTEKMFALAAQGTTKALEFWHTTATHIGNGLVGVVNLFNPQLIVIGGGVSNNERFLFPTIKAVIQKRAMSLQASMVKIKRLSWEMTRYYRRTGSSSECVNSIKKSSLIFIR